MVPKKDGSTWFYVDFRKVNAISKFGAYPMPRVDELLDRLGGALLVSTFDLTKGYWQIPLTQSSQQNDEHTTMELLSTGNAAYPTEYYDDNFNEGYVYLCDIDGLIQFGEKFVPCFYYLVFLLSLLGNGLVLYIIFKFEKLTTVTNIFILNLVISDLVFASSLPFWASYHSSEWIFGSTMCKLMGSVYFIGFYSSIMFLTLMTFDRYLAVVHAVIAAKRRRIVYALISSAVVWGISFGATIKELVLYDIREDNGRGTVCEETGYPADFMEKLKLVGYFQQVMLFFLLPLIVVLYCYSRIVITVIKTKMKEKCRAIKLIFLIVVTFFLCWTPYNVVIFLKVLQIMRSSTSVDCNNDLDYALYVTRNIAYLYFCVNPVFYTFVGKKFQGHFTKLFSKWNPFRIRSQSSHSGRTSDHRNPQTLI
ncbi:C-C chemokine receptor type 4-like isoform X1 [Polyodon spathula]|uniref:C-C chemokine receptor type 4-like isoform X1 n=1 Tax=Polyodon spathula TaxID=7913 RepID=UPI001B7DBB2D|nr:C-C chemokine receptor type 4-like isoform X1 [Polyodon spathula]XP_041103892.1 C-C chemokine receptor type 4-like isoform X1 [Polyodon spathula]XP_041103893.1 C-C chemokine receptor type 4-like isoform X1 [Polyodon spathula]XP_041103894.1 C-C chemokine receptor type 4-like isoform X1 [Polyodon spathula]